MIRPVFLGVLLLLSACAPGVQPSLPLTSSPEAAAIIPPADQIPTASATPSLVKLPTLEVRPPQLTELPLSTPEPSGPLICSPLEGIRIAELSQPDLMKNPFQPPRPGMDDGHQGVDFAYWSRGERKTMLGLPVLSALAGRVAGIIHNRQPYGNAIIIETPLNGFPRDILAQIALPTQAPTVQPAPSLFCPTVTPSQPAEAGRSLYLLYAHLNQTPEGLIGQHVSCGQTIGEVGTTGKSVNPHLHFETRLGPSGMVFKEMAHYENDATEEEMYTYCTWRVSGLFQMFDPLILLHIDSLQP